MRMIVLYFSGGACCHFWHKHLLSSLLFQIRSGLMFCCCSKDSKTENQKRDPHVGDLLNTQKTCEKQFKCRLLFRRVHNFIYSDSIMRGSKNQQKNPKIFIFPLLSTLILIALDTIYRDLMLLEKCKRS